jgi:signal transduction histidine kinase/ActR/RegA family two-component response regulator
MGKTEKDNSTYKGQTSPEPQLKILMIEDNPGDVVLIREILKSGGLNFCLTHAPNLKKVLSYSENTRFDVILLDLGLTESIGLETLKLVKGLNLDTPIVVMTGLDDEGIALESLREGAQDYLVKSKLDSNTVLRAIIYGIERKKIQDLLKKHTRQFSLLSTATGTITRLEDISSIYDVTCENITLLLGNASTLVVEIKDNGVIQMSCTEWLQPWADKIEEIAGIMVSNPVLKTFHLDESYALMFNDGKLHEIGGGLFSIFSGKVKKADCEKLERLLKINNIYAIGFAKGIKLYGGAIIFSSGPVSDDDAHVIETIASQASLSIHKRVIEKELRISEYRYRKLNKELEQKVKERTLDLEFANNKLQDELEERTRAQDALRKSKAELTELNTTKDKFFNIVAHDLKNPFTSLLGSSELLYENIDNMDSKTIKSLAMILNDSAKGGYSILQNLLDWSRSQTGQIKIKPEKIDLKALIDQNTANLQLPASVKSIAIESETDMNQYIISDFNMVNTVLRNLLSNAIKFTPRGGMVRVFTKAEKDEMVITVKDSGIGIAKEKVETLFSIDAKHSDPGTDNEQGTGLGLKLCKEFAEKLGGRIWVESEEKKGSEFKFAVPLKTR